MASETRGMLGGTLFAVLLPALALTFFVPEPAPARAEGVRWQALSVEEALAEAGRRDGRVLVKFDAEWCSYCRTLDAEVFQTRYGAALTEDMIAVSFDFDDPDNRALVERYVVLGLPTVLVLAPDGTQVGRIQGYEGREQWLGEARRAKAASDPVPALRAAFEASPDDPVAALRLGEALLVRGVPDEGEALLERVTWLRGEGADEASAEALFLLGRYHHRVRQDPRTARHVWRELATRHPGSGWAGGAWWWYAKAQAEIGQHAVGLAALRQRARDAPADASAVSQWASYVAEHDLDGDREAVSAAIEVALRTADAEAREELEEAARDL